MNLVQNQTRLNAVPMNWVPPLGRTGWSTWQPNKNPSARFCLETYSPWGKIHTVFNNDKWEVEGENEMGIAGISEKS